MTGEITTIQVSKINQARLNKFKHQYELESLNDAIRKALDIVDALPDAEFRTAYKVLSEKHG
jgi:hypothetical protein